jgi:hypothetical protein
VVVDRPPREDEPIGDLGVLTTLGHECEHLSLALGEAGGARLGLRPGPARQPSDATLT